MKDLRIHIAAGTVVQTVLILLGFYLLFTIREILFLVVVSVIIAAAVEPAAKWFIRHRIPRIPAVLGIYIVAISIFAGLFYFFIPPLFSEVVNFIHMIPTYVSELHLSYAVPQSSISHFTDTISLQDVLNEFRQFASNTSGGFFALVSTVFGGVLGFILVLVLSFYLAVQEQGVENFLRLVTPIKSQKYVINLWGRAQKKIGLWLQGQLLLALIIGVLVFLGLTLLGFQNAFFLAVLSGVFELIPVFGPILAGVPVSLVGLAMSPTTGLLTIAFYILVQQFENHVIQPLVVQKVIGISPIVAIISLIIGGSLGGFLGVLVSIPIAAVVMEFLGDVSKEKSIEAERWEEERLEERQRRGKERTRKEKKIIVRAKKDETIIEETEDETEVVSDADQSEDESQNEK